MMTEQSQALSPLFPDIRTLRRLFLSDHSNPDDTHSDSDSHRSSSASAGAGNSSSGEDSPNSSNSSFHEMSPENQDSPVNQESPYVKSPWIRAPAGQHRNGLIGSSTREDGHVHSLASSGGLLYTGSDKKNIRVWNNLDEYSGFKTRSGLVKAIVISGDQIFTGHQDGKIRVWKYSPGNYTCPYTRAGSFPSVKESVKTSLTPKNCAQVRRSHDVVPSIKHSDVVSSLSLDEEHGILYSGSWDRTVKVWRISDFKCLESINAHDDVINAVAYGPGGLVFSGSADGTVKVWRMDDTDPTDRTTTKHVLVDVLLRQENAVTSLAVNEKTLYCGSSDGLVNFWETGKCIHHGGVLRGHKLAVMCLATAGNLVFSGSADKSICVWRRGLGGDHTCSAVLAAHSGPVKCLAVEEDEESQKRDLRWILYSGSFDKSVKVWRVSDQ